MLKRLFSFFSIKHDNYFRIYSVIFCIFVSLERYYLWDWVDGLRAVYTTSFYSYNYIRFALICIPFVHLSFIPKEKSKKDRLIKNLPFLFLCFSVIALPLAQLIYLSLFVAACFFVKALRPLGAAGLILACTMAIILIPNYNGGGTRSFNSDMRGRLSALQGMVEIYAVDHSAYPESVLQLREAANKEGYWKKIQNPLTGKSGHNMSFRDISERQLAAMKKKKQKVKKQAKNSYTIDFLGIRLVSIPAEREGIAGEALYYSQSKDKYTLYGVSSDGFSLLLDSRGRPVFISNSY